LQVFNIQIQPHSEASPGELGDEMSVQRFLFEQGSLLNQLRHIGSSDLGFLRDFLHGALATATNMVAVPLMINGELVAVGVARIDPQTNVARLVD